MMQPAPPSPLSPLWHQNDAFFSEVAERVRRDIQKVKGPQVAVLVKALASLKFSNRELYDTASLQLQFTMQDIGLSHVSGQGGVCRTSACRM